MTFALISQLLKESEAAPNIRSVQYLQSTKPFQWFQNKAPKLAQLIAQNWDLDAQSYQRAPDKFTDSLILNMLTNRVLQSKAPELANMPAASDALQQLRQIAISAFSPKRAPAEDKSVWGSQYVFSRGGDRRAFGEAAETKRRVLIEQYRKINSK